MCGYFLYNMNPNTLSPELQQAIQNRGQGQAPTPALNQTQQNAPAPMPPAPSASVPGSVDMGAMPQQKTEPEEMIITKALIQRQKMLGNLVKQTKEQPTIQQMPVS